MMAETSTPSLALSRQSLQEFCAFVTDRLGIKMSSAKLPLLQSRLQRRLRELGLPSLEAYREYLFHSPDGAAEEAHFIDAVTTNKTDFFREPEHFAYLTRTALPAIDRDPTAPWTCRIWCAGCSSGEEPYTLAMVLSEHATQRAGFDFTILATDISQRVLQAAERGVYDAARVEPVAPALRRKYLLRHRDPARPEVRVAPELRGRVSFRRLNFMDEDYGVRGGVDVIFFRNVMIYFDKATQEQVLRKLCRSLIPGGYLFVGHSESLAGLDVPLTCVGAAVYRKPR